ncbi:hypothetical protein ATN50_07710 [Vibrio parahaemolyticus]|nr:hypothetical protein [Vibrio parahaemolyticus]RFD49267.1 hypothetical protein H332_008885 [Vibrio parahaemolyticus 3646]RFD54988.1 hypothetical protein H330_021125 [Vibrio parahaemolyticus 3631]EGR1167340.1 hypothetical protein [Vibrio parahaemolyticus]EGR1302725.1 hypothetical protein [Vibrio parahaemolyticus]
MTPPSIFDVSGVVQKGPLQPGSVVTLHELNDKMEQTGKSFDSQIQDYDGSYAISENLNSDFVEVFSKGYFYNELSGDSSKELTLSSYYELKPQSTLSINIVTTLIKGKLKKLILEQNLPFSEASELATKELLEIYGYSESKTPDFYTVSLQQGSDAAAILLAMSSLTLYLADMNDIEPTAQIALLANYLEEDNLEKIVETKSKLLQAQTKIDTFTIESNVSSYFQDHGLDFEAPSLLYFIDNDGDGKLPDKTIPILQGYSVAAGMPSIDETVEIELPINVYDYQGRNWQQWPISSSLQPKFGTVEYTPSEQGWTAKYTITIKEQIDRIDDHFTAEVITPDGVSNSITLYVAMF